VVIRAYSAKAGTELVLEVEDDGPGIPAEKREIILARGERADPSVPGHGIGLAVVKGLVEENYQGRFEIRAGELGGALVRVRLPIGNIGHG
jgi:two-component system sensor histidine kinase PhoQ